MRISIEQAYDEACRLLGAAVVKEQFLTSEVSRLTASEDTEPDGE